MDETSAKNATATIHVLTDHICFLCSRSFRSSHGLNIHLSACKKNVKTPLVEADVITAETIQQTDLSQINFFWNVVPGSEFSNKLNHVYNKIVHWRKNLFKLPSGNSGKHFIKECTRLLNSWVTKSALRPVAIKAFMVMPSLLLQKPSKRSKSKEHIETLNRRLDLWSAGKLDELLLECNSIQSRLKTHSGPLEQADLSKKFGNLMSQGKVSQAINLLTNNMEGGILPLNSETMALLSEKHPPPNAAPSESLLEGVETEIHPIIFEEIDADTIFKAALNTRGGSGPSGMDADGWRRILCSKSFGLVGDEFRQSLANFVKSLCTEIIDTSLVNNHVTSSIEAFLACRLLPFDKNPGLRPIGVGEVIRRIAGKAVMSVVSPDIQDSVGSLQLCGGQQGGCEAAIHAMRSIYENEETDAVLLVDASNAFNSLNRNAMLHNIKILCPPIYVYAFNCYATQARLFIIGGKELHSKEGTTQGDPTAMALYGLGLVPLIAAISQSSPRPNIDVPVKHVAYADDLTGAGKLHRLRQWWDAVETYGPSYGYNPEPTKSWLIVKEDKFELAKKIFENTGVKITTEGHRHLGASLGTSAFRDNFVNKLVENWVNQVLELSKIAVTEPHASYSAYVTGLQHKFTYTLRTIPNIKHLLDPLEKTIRNKLIPALTEGRQISDDERILLSLPPRLGGLNIRNPITQADEEFENSKAITSALVSLIKNQIVNLDEKSKNLTDIKNNIRKQRQTKQESLLQDLRTRMTETQLRINEVLCQPGASSWLTSLPLEQQNLTLSKREFWDAICLRYSWHLNNIPTNCFCGSQFTVSHALSCKKGGFVIQRHNTLRDLTAEILNEVCTDVAVEPILDNLTGEKFILKTANTAEGARLDVSARGVFNRGQKHFCDIRVFDPTAQSHLKKTLTQCYLNNEQEKKRAYNDRILQVENGTFTPAVFSVFGGMSRECLVFYNRLSELLSEKRNEHRSLVTTWLRTKVSFALLRASLLCIRGSRSHRTSNNYQSTKDADIRIDVTEANMETHF